MGDRSLGVPLIRFSLKVHLDGLMDAR